MSIEKALGKLRAAQMCHPNAVQALIDEAITAIQQAEAQQPATGEPVLVQHRKPVIGWKGETIGYTAWMDGKGLDGWPHRELYDRPAPIVPATPEPVAWNSIQIASWIGSQLMHEPSMFERAAVCKFVRSLGRHPTLLKHSR